MTRHLLDDPGALTPRAQLFLSDHARREEKPQAWSDGTRTDELRNEWYECTDLDGGPVAGPEDGFALLLDFVTRYGGLSFCHERPGCDGKHSHTYRFDATLRSGWVRTESGGWVAEVGEVHGWPLMLDRETGRLGVDIHQPETWIAHSLLNLVESAALGQSIYLSDRWREASPAQGKARGWKLETGALERLQRLVPEVTEASSPWNRWLMNDDVAVHGWAATYEPTRQMTAMAWHRTPAGRRQVEQAVGPLA